SLVTEVSVTNWFLNPPKQATDWSAKIRYLSFWKRGASPIQGMMIGDLGGRGKRAISVRSGEIYYTQPFTSITFQVPEPHPIPSMSTSVNPWSHMKYKNPSTAIELLQVVLSGVKRHSYIALLTQLFYSVTTSKLTPPLFLMYFKRLESTYVNNYNNNNKRIYSTSIATTTYYRPGWTEAKCYDQHTT
ncbi:uncharacterized protein BO96DRAFT_351652, partial [Aspergillus niger CBS 101883]|uniref:uncharacterized protein n=1 Tax=Aspergillus lacticoffeatus (strain CBS 101883) TaxID=1450533 RepID=UPI000D7EE81D